VEAVSEIDAPFEEILGDYEFESGSGEEAL